MIPFLASDRLLVLFFLVALSACGGTGTGNPERNGDPGGNEPITTPQGNGTFSEYVRSIGCSKIVACQQADSSGTQSVSQETCEARVDSETTTLDAEIGLPVGVYTPFQAVIAAEAAHQISANSYNAVNCASEIQLKSCLDPSVIAALPGGGFDPSAFAHVFVSGSGVNSICADIF